MGRVRALARVRRARARTRRVRSASCRHTARRERVSATAACMADHAAAAATEEELLRELEALAGCIGGEDEIDDLPF